MKFYYLSLLTLIVNAQDTAYGSDSIISTDSSTYGSSTVPSETYTSILPSSSHHNKKKGHKFNGNDAYICLPINKDSYTELLNLLPSDIQSQVSSIIASYQSNLSTSTDSNTDTLVPTGYDDSSDSDTGYDVTSTDDSSTSPTDSSVTSTTNSSVSPTDSSTSSDDSNNVYTLDSTDNSASSSS